MPRVWVVDYAAPPSERVRLRVPADAKPRATWSGPIVAVNEETGERVTLQPPPLHFCEVVETGGDR